MVQMGRAFWVLVVGVVLSGAGVARAEPLLNHDIQLSDSSGLLQNVTIRPTSDTFTYNWLSKQGTPLLQIAITQTKGNETDASVMISGLANFTFADSTTAKPTVLTIMDPGDKIPPLIAVNIHDIVGLNLDISDPTVQNFPGGAPPTIPIDVGGVAVTNQSSLKADLTFTRTTPEPGTLGLFALGMVSLTGFARRRLRRRANLG